MITEKQFALGCSGFWQGLLPMLERHIRAVNVQVQRFAPPIVSSAPAASRGLVSELAFRLFVASVRTGLPIADLPSDEIGGSVEAATTHIRRMRQLSRRPVPDPRSLELAEATILAERHARFFQRTEQLTLLPTFPGCGWLMECAGDVLSGATLYEVKAGERGFRSIDMRQTLIYCALNFAAKRYDIAAVCLVNPRLGIVVEEDLEHLCGAASGAPAVEVLAAIVEYCSESQERYQIG